MLGGQDRDVAVVLLVAYYFCLKLPLSLVWH